MGLLHADSDESSTAPADFKVVLKLDDIWKTKSGGLPPKWQRMYDYAEANQLPFTMGVICNNIVNATPEFYDTLKAWQASGLIEFWNHGFDHKRWEVDGETVYEFSGSGYEHQLKHFQDAQDIGRDLLGIEFTTFGAPFNQVDADTERMLESFPEITAWLYGPWWSKVGPTVIKANWNVKMEVKTGVIDFEAFKTAYSTHTIGPILALQGHPMSWDDNDFLAFTQVVDFLRSEGATFVLPHECVSSSDDQ
jgi:peptidoglycan/xylan/chitin deacetylase (PgdA/CDA1 family)